MRARRLPFHFHLLRTASALLVVVLLLAGCGRRSPGGPAGSGANVFRYALQSAPTTLDPALVEDGDTIDLLMQVFEGLVQWDPDNRIVPNVAQKWEVSPDGRTYTFHLNDNVRFHNGRRLVAQDFVYSLTRTLLPGTRSPTAKTYLYDIVGAADVKEGRTRELKGVRAVDERTLQIVTDRRKPYFLGKLTYPTAYVVCREAVEGNGGRVDEKAMVGTGPFKLKEYRPGYSVSLAANRDYHGVRPVLDGIERPILPDSNARQLKFESGGTDLTDVQRADLPRLQQDPTLSKQLHTFRRAAIWYLALNQAKVPQFRDKRVRQAFARAIDKDQLIRLALNGTGQKASGIVPPGVPGHDPGLVGLPYDPEQARGLLAAAGYPGGRGFPRVLMTYRQGYKFAEDAALAMRSDLQKNLGVTVDTQPIEWARFLTERNNGTMDCYHLRWAADYLDPQDFLSVMLHTGSPENTIGYSSKEFDRLCDLADVEPDPAKRMDLYRRAERIAVDDAPWVCLYYQEDIELHKPYLKGLRDCLMGHLPHVTTSVTGR